MGKVMPLANRFGARNCRSNKSLQSKEPFRGSSKKKAPVLGLMGNLYRKNGTLADSQTVRAKRGGSCKFLRKFELKYELLVGFLGSDHNFKDLQGI